MKLRIKKRKLIFAAVILIALVMLIIATSKMHIVTLIKENNLAENLTPIIENVREPIVADQFYPADKSQLESMLSKFYSNSKKSELNGTLKALIVPHAGYVYSGQVAANGFSLVPAETSNVLIIGANHNGDVNFRGIAVSNYTSYLTPMGKVSVSSSLQSFEGVLGFSVVQGAEDSHVVEVELPFLQNRLKDFDIIPLVTGQMSLQDIEAAAGVISGLSDNGTLLVVSSDLSHYHQYAEAVALDTSCIKNIEALDFESATRCEACGLNPILILLQIAKEKGWSARIIDYKNSGDTSGDKSSVVGYSAITFFKKEDKEKGLSREEEQLLLRLARETASQYLKNNSKPQTDSLTLTENLKKVQGCFVTFNKNGMLRGCIGHILPQEPLYLCVMDNAVNAAVHDPRFKPVSFDELKDIEMEISVLTPPSVLEYQGALDLLNKLVPNRDGVVIDYNGRQSTYLPQVWGNFGGSKEDFMSSLCEKQGSEPECWKKNPRVFTYQALVFNEQELE